MLLIGLLVPMTIASSSIDFDVNTVLFDNQEIAITVDVLKSVHLGKTKSMITMEVAEGIRKRSHIGSKVDIYISAFPPEHGLWPLMVEGRPIVQIQARCKADSENDNQLKEITNYIRADTDNIVSINYDPLRGSDIQDFKKAVLLNAVIG